jgi:type II secretory pathway pseudopilin PulG
MFWHKVFGNKKINHSGRRQQSGFTPPLRAGAGFTFLEIALSLLILTVGALSMLQCVNVAMDANYRAQQEVIANNLAGALMNEIMSKFFEETINDNSIGVEDETAFQRTAAGGFSFDDVDDYNGYNDGPARTIAPIMIDNNFMDGNLGRPNYQGFSRSVTVNFVEALDLIPAGGDGILEYYDRFVFFPTKRIIVTVNGPGVVNFQSEGIKTQ